MKVADSRRATRIDDFKAGELGEVIVRGSDSPDSMFVHERCRMNIKEEISGRLTQFRYQGAQAAPMPFRRAENSEIRN